MNDVDGQAFQIHQALNYGHKYMDEMGYDIEPVELIYNHLGNFYFSDSIYLEGGEYKDWDLILHEYGHHVMTTLGFSNFPYLSIPYDHTGTEIHFLERGKESGARFAWAEAWPSVFALQVTKYYSSDLSTIDNVGDDYYNDFGATNYDMDEALGNGESVERDIASVLFDMYDTHSFQENFDNISLSHKTMIDLSVNSQAGTFSDFVNHYYSLTNLPQNDFYKLLEEGGMAPYNLTANIDVSYTPPSYTWSAGGCVSEKQYENDRFDIVFTNDDGEDYYVINDIYTTSYQLNTEQWNNVLSGYGDNFYVSVKGYETTDYETGGYRSSMIKYSKMNLSTPPIENILFLSFNRYHEEITSLYNSNHIQEYEVFFQYSGYKIIQTFGEGDIMMEIYDNYGNLVKTNDDSGANENSFVLINTNSNSTYTIKIYHKNPMENGQVKLGIFPTKNSSYTDFSKISNYTMPIGSKIISFGLPKNYVTVFTLNILQTMDYVFETSKYQTETDTYLYITDVTISSPTLEDDDSGTQNGYSKIIADLEIGHTYLIILSVDDISTDSGDTTITISRN